MQTENFTILLADDDTDDTMFFRDALEELSIPVSFNSVGDGVELMNLLNNKAINQLPDVLFLDLNMPLKSGVECLSEIKQNKKLNQLSVVIYSTSMNPQTIEVLYNKGAKYYIRKPADFANLKSVIKKAIVLCKKNNSMQPKLEEFLIEP